MNNPTLNGQEQTSVTHNSFVCQTPPSQTSSSTASNRLTTKDYQHCCGHDISQKERGLNPDWTIANCYSATIPEASQLLGYQAKSPCIVIEGSNGQYQLRPHKPWADKQGKKAPKYRTATGDEYDALLPAHPTDKYYWTNLDALKQRCYQIDGHPYILITEGGFKAISACSHNLPTISLLGVEMGLTSSKDDPQGKRYLVPALERLAAQGFGFILAFDADLSTKPAVKQALIKLAAALLKFKVPLYLLPPWDEERGKGIDDYIQMNGIEAFRQQLIANSIPFESWYQENGQSAFSKPKPPKPDIIGALIAEQYREHWIYCDELQSWLAYSLETEGIWTVVSDKYLAAEIHAILKAKNIVGYGSNSYINNIIGTLQRELYTRQWSETPSSQYLPFRNGVLELATGQLHPHSPGFRLTWQLPRDYTLVDVGWSKIDQWFNQATQGNSEHKQILLCFAAAVLRGRNDLQKFLHLIGSGGSGKSTFTNLLTALIGSENTATLNLSDLEDKHEIARIFGKRLVVLPDQDKAPKRMSNFKRMTGQDNLSGRRLFENGFEFVFAGLTVVHSNFPLFHTNLGSWLIRRLIMIPFKYQCPKEQQKDLMKEFEPELGALTQYLLNIPEAEIEAVLKGLGKQALNSTVWESQTRSDALSAWVNDCLVEDNTAISRIGSDSREWRVEEDYDPAISTLYGSYALYCRQTLRSAKSPQNFSAELLELTVKTLGWAAEKTRVKMAGKTVRVIRGLRLRTDLDARPTVEEILEGDNQDDNQDDNQGDNLKPLKNKECDNGDNLKQTNEENKNNFSPSCDSPPTGTIPQEVKSNLPLNNSSQVVTPVTAQLQQGIEAVTEVVTQAVTEVVTPTINWSTYPWNSGDEKTLKNRANKVKERIFNCQTNNDLIKLLANGKVSEREIDWLIKNLLTKVEIEQVETIQKTTQGNIFLQPTPNIKVGDRVIDHHQNKGTVIEVMVKKVKVKYDNIGGETLICDVSLDCLRLIS